VGYLGRGFGLWETTQTENPAPPLEPQLQVSEPVPSLETHVKSE